MSDIALRGMPGVADGLSSSHRIVFKQFSETFLAGGRQIDGLLARDTGNTGSLTTLRPGVLMGKVTASGLYANSAYGLSTVAIAAGDTTITAAAAVWAEVLRRKGASGTFKVYGPTAANGVPRVATATYSAIGTTTATITPLGANQVEQINFNIASTGGNLQLRIQKPDGTFATTGNAAWSATDATYLANINTALDAASGVVGGIVASAIPAVDPDLGIRLTYSGTGYAGIAWTPATVAVFPTSSTLATYQNITAAVSGLFASGSLIQPVDGSENIVTFIPDGTGVKVTDSDTGLGITVPFPRLPVAGIVDGAQLLPWPSDTGLQAAIKAQLSSYGLGKYVFSDGY